MNDSIKKIANQIIPWIPPIFFNQVFYVKILLDYQKYKSNIVRNKRFKDIHKGQRCFLLGSGPSILNQDLTSLKDEVVFALNNFYVHPDFKLIMSGNRPKYYLTAMTHPPQTRKEWIEWFSDMSKNMSPNVKMIFGLNNYKDNIFSIIQEEKLFSKNDISWYYSAISTNSLNYDFKLKHIDLTLPILSAETVSVYALIAAIYMGFDEIYLIGMDHNYINYKSQEEYRFYKNAIHQKDEEKKLNEISKTSQNARNLIATGNIFKQYEMIRNNTKARIYNLSPFSLCDVFEFKKIEKILNNPY